ncbi:MAG: signal peptidase I [Clostridia bacterium]|jgi:signal peptidase I|nr:signal peptidase I [Clostridia bacterium]
MNLIKKYKEYKENIKNKIVYEIIDWIEIIVSSLIIVLIIKSFLFEHTVVVGPSMQNTLQDGEHLIISRLNYYFEKPSYGDIIIFPHKDLDGEKIFIKRIIGEPGDVIDIKEGSVYKNDKKLEEDYIKELIATYREGNQDYPVTVPEDEYFVMGDNRNNSRDSRYIDVDTVERKDIIGKSVLRIWPFNKFGTVK